MLFQIEDGYVEWGGRFNLSLVSISSCTFAKYKLYETAGKSLNSIEILCAEFRLCFDHSSYCLLYGRIRRFYDRK